MGRNLTSYRAARRNQARDDDMRFPWDNIKPRKYVNPTKGRRENKRDRSVPAEAKRKDRAIVMNFLGYSGLLFWWTRQEEGTHARTKAEDARKAREQREKDRLDRIRNNPFKNYFWQDPEKVQEIRDWHIHPRHKRPEYVKKEAAKRKAERQAKRHALRSLSAV